jgi:hypothetical protein
MGWAEDLPRMVVLSQPCSRLPMEAAIATRPAPYILNDPCSSTKINPTSIEPGATMSTSSRRRSRNRRCPPAAPAQLDVELLAPAPSHADPRHRVKNMTFASRSLAQAGSERKKGFLRRARRRGRRRARRKTRASGDAGEPSLRPLWWFSGLRTPLRSFGPVR